MLDKAALSSLPLILKAVPLAKVAAYSVSLGEYMASCSGVGWTVGFGAGWATGFVVVFGAVFGVIFAWTFVFASASSASFLSSRDRRAILSLIDKLSAGFFAEAGVRVFS